MVGCCAGGDVVGEGLPIEVRKLPEDLVALDGLSCDPRLLAVPGALAAEALLTGVSADGRATLAIETYVWLMVSSTATTRKPQPARGGPAAAGTSPSMPTRPRSRSARNIATV